VWRNESRYWMGSQLIINFWVLYDTLRRHLHLMGLTSSPLCRRCGTENETSAHILCECEALTSIRHLHLDSFFLEPKDIKSLSLGAIWNFGKGTGHAWGDRGKTQWLRCCATNQKVAGSIPAGVIGIFHRHEILSIALWRWGWLSL